MMSPSEWIGRLVHDLFEHYGAEVLPSGLRYLELRMDGYGVLIVEEKIKNKQMCVCYWLYDAQGHPVPEPEVVFHIDAADHWIPYEIRRHTAGNYSFADLELGSGELLSTDPRHQAALAAFADSWADILRAQGWVGGADKVITQPQAWPEEEDAPPQAPDAETLWNWVDEYGKCQATDSCWVEPDGTCEHGHPSWLVALGLI
jgi:hypothetical protein